MFLVLLSGLALGQEQATVNLGITLIDLQRAVFTTEVTDSLAMHVAAGTDVFQTNLAQINTYKVPVKGRYMNSVEFLKNLHNPSTLARVKREDIRGGKDNNEPPTGEPNTLVIYEVIPD